MARYPNSRTAGLLPMKNLEMGEVSAVYRVRSTAEVADWWQALNAEERGQLLAQLYVADAPRRERQAVAERQAAAKRLWEAGEFATQGELAQHLGVSESTLSGYIGRRIDGRKTRVEENLVLHGIVRDLLARTEVKFFWKEVLTLARAAGDNRTERKITYTARRIRREMEEVAPQVAPVVKAAPKLIRKQFNAAQNRRRTAEEGQQEAAEGKSPQAVTEGQDEAKRKLARDLHSRRPKKGG